MILKYILIILLQEPSICMRYKKDNEKTAKKFQNHHKHEEEENLMEENNTEIEKFNKKRRKYYILVMSFASCYFVTNLYVIIQYINNTLIIFSTVKNIIMFSMHIVLLVITMVITFFFLKSRHQCKKSIECWKLLNHIIFLINIINIIMFLVVNISFPQSNFIISLNEYLFLDANIHFTDVLGIIFMVISSIKIIFNIIIYCSLNAMQKIIKNLY